MAQKTTIQHRHGKHPAIGGQYKAPPGKIAPVDPPLTEQQQAQPRAKTPRPVRKKK